MGLKVDKWLSPFIKWGRVSPMLLPSCTADYKFSKFETSMHFFLVSDSWTSSYCKYSW